MLFKEITDADLQVAVSQRFQMTSPRPSSLPHLKMMMTQGWTLTWTPLKHPLTVNHCSSPSVTWTWKVRGQRFKYLRLHNWNYIFCDNLNITGLFSRWPAASWCGVPASKRIQLQYQLQIWFSDWFSTRNRPEWTGSSGAGGHGGQSGHQVALFLHRWSTTGEPGQHECPGSVSQGAVTWRYNKSLVWWFTWWLPDGLPVDYLVKCWSSWKPVVPSLSSLRLLWRRYEWHHCVFFLLLAPE